MEVTLIYPVNAKCELDSKVLNLNQDQLIALLLSSKLGSEGHYYTIKDKIFEDTKNGLSLSVMLEDEI